MRIFRLAGITCAVARRVAPLLMLVAVSAPAGGQEKLPWHGHKCAVALTYDDGLNVHLDTVVPLLDSLGFRGTFYLSGSFPGLRGRLRDWARAAREGHELGNHTLFHPCEGGKPGRDWVSPDYDLRTYTLRRIVDEIQMTNTLLEAIDGRRTRTFAYPCGDRFVGDSSYVDRIREIFPGARGVQGRMEQVEDIDLYDVGAYMISGQSAIELTGLVKEAMARNALLVFLFHGVGGEHSINVSSGDHRQLLAFLKQSEKEVWVAPLLEIVQYIREARKMTAFPDGGGGGR